jgi:hypothetical protein
MNALLLTEYMKLELVDFPEPEIGPEDVLVRVRTCGICGSDVHGFDGSSGRRNPPLIMGHEAAGKIAKLGANVTGLKAGDRVTFDSTVYCGKCAFTAFMAFARNRLYPLALRLGWDAQATEESNAATLRDAVLVALSRFGDEAVIAEARRRFEIALQNPREASPAVRRTALSIVARHADAETLDRLITLLRATHDPLEKQNTFEALADIADISGAQRVLELAVGPDAPAGTAAYIVFYVSREHPDLAWNFALHVDQPGSPIDPSMRLRLMPGIASGSSDRKRATDLETYADQHIPTSARQYVKAAISNINLNVKFKAERLPEIDRWLASKTAH